MNRNPQEEIEEIEEEDNNVNAPAWTVNKVAAPPEEIKEADYVNAPACTVDKVAAPPEEIKEADYVNAPACTVDKVAAPPEEIIEEASYVNVPACTVDKVTAPPHQRSLFFTQSFPLIAVCWLILLVIMGLRIHCDTVLESKIANLTADVQNLTTQNLQLNSRNQELETQRKNLTERIQDMETTWNKLNVSRAQWTIDAYCPKTNNVRQCKPCQNGWKRTESNCYAYNNAEPPNQKTWEEAQQDCRGKSSDLAVVHSQDEQTALNKYSVGSSGTNGYWFGLRAEGGRWKWIDGSNLTESYWTPQPPPTATDGQCGMSVQNVGWRSVNCTEKKQWICEMKD
ncbi:C-type lectin domain family 10 member A-like isoform X1 [Sander lucioperca]|uniref:C-type lectin domain family 10 member A-like isoform X1 n=1 Tax=Sander lucioperca TaxID=283035 RepID=UPI0016538440|nr:C-type lectin domain family 10 member A-like isoform X1 [Sander lucioperca]